MVWDANATVLFRHFGKEIIASRVHATPEEEKVQTLWLKLYKEYIEAIDAIDNGIHQYPTDLQPKYRIRTDISSRVGYLNPAWNQPADAAAVDVSRPSPPAPSTAPAKLSDRPNSCKRPLWWATSSSTG